MNIKTLVDVPICLGKYEDFVDSIIGMASTRVSSYVCVLNVHMLVEAYFKDSFKEIIQNADIIVPDGMPITWALRFLNGTKQERVAGMDLLPSLLQKVEQKDLSVYFYGGTDNLLNKTKKVMKSRYPSLRVAGFKSPPFRKLSEKEDQAVVESINASGANIVFVVLGCPKQEKWMSSMKGKINAVMIGIGGALPVMVGLQRRAPEWMQEIGMEWLYRLYMEPRRLFKRYAITNTIFFYLISKELLKKKLVYSTNTTAC